MPLLDLTFASGETSLSVRRFAVEEALSTLFTVSVWARSSDPSIDLSTIVGQDASFRIASGYAYALGGGARLWTGIVNSASQIQAEPTGLSTYFVRIVPRLWILTQRRNYRIFQHLSIPDIADKLLAEWGFEPAWKIHRAAYPPLEYKVQYGESDYDFLSRILEEAGITFTFPDDDKQGSRLTLADEPEAAAPRAGPALPFVDNPNAASELEYVSRVRLGHAVRPGALAIRDHDFRSPAYNLLGQAPKANKPEDQYEQFHYRPGAFLTEGHKPERTPAADDRGVARHDKEFGDNRAERALLGARAGRETVAFETNTTDLWPGAVFSIGGHPHTEIPDRPLLVTRFSLEGTPNDAWSMAGEAVFADQPYRPPLRALKPVVHGVQSGTVVGPKGQEIHTDEFGRVRVELPWDREGTGSDASSCWIRVNQGWGGRGYGVLILPRVGQEVLVAFENGDPDRPVLVGRVFNAMNPVPYKLPENKTISAWKSDSSPGGGGFNEIKFEDKKGAELVYVQAEKNLRKLVKNDETITVLRHRDKNVVVDETDTTGVNRVEVTGANRTETVGASRTTLIGGARRKLVKAREDVRTEGNHQRLVAKNLDAVVKGARRELIEDDAHLTVRGNRAEKIDGDQSITVIDSRFEKVTGSYALDAGKEMHVASGEILVGEGASDVTLKGPGGYIRIDPMGVTITGTLVKINVGGSPGKGKGAKPKLPAEPKEPAIEEPAADGEPPELPPSAEARALAEAAPKSAEQLTSKAAAPPAKGEQKAPTKADECEIEKVEIACEHDGKRKAKLILPPDKDKKRPANVIEVVGANSGSGDSIKTSIKMRKPRCATHKPHALTVRSVHGTIHKAEDTSTVEVVYGAVVLETQLHRLIWPWGHSPVDYSFTPGACAARGSAAIVRVYPAYKVSASIQLGLDTEERVKGRIAAAQKKGYVEKRGRPANTDWFFEIKGKIKYGNHAVELGYKFESDVKKWAAFNRLIKRAVDLFCEYFFKFTGVTIVPEFPKLGLNYEGEFKEIDESWRVGAEWSITLKADPLIGLTVRIEILDCLIKALQKTQFRAIGVGLEKVRDWAKKKDQTFEIYLAFSGLIGGEVGAKKSAASPRATPSGSIEGKLKVEFAAKASFGSKGVIGFAVGAEVGAETGIAAKLALDNDAKGVFFKGTMTLLACKFKYAAWASGKFYWEIKESYEGEYTFWEDIDFLKTSEKYVLQGG
jgi:type VI secretion system secreted protein VgrG